MGISQGQTGSEKHMEIIEQERTKTRKVIAHQSMYENKRRNILENK